MASSGSHDQGKKKAEGKKIKEATATGQEKTIMASSGSHDQGKKKVEGKNKVEEATMVGEEKKTKTKKALMTQEEIDSHIRYQTVEFREDAILKVGDQYDDYVAKIIRDINRIESRLMKARNYVLDQYYKKGYVEQDAYEKGYHLGQNVSDGEEASPAGSDGEEALPAGDQETLSAGDQELRAPCPGRRRFRPGVSISRGKINKLN